MSLWEKAKAAWGGVASAASTALGFISGAGSVAGAVTETAKAVEKGEELVQESNQRVAGADHVTAVDNAKKAEAIDAAADAVINTTDAGVSKQLRDGSA